MPSTRKYFQGLTANTFLLAFASFFADISTEMLYPVLPVFLTQLPGGDATVLGLVEGVAQAVQNIVQGFSGWLADRLRRHKALALVGYTMAACSKPLIGLSTSWTGVLGARSLDRLATGIRSAPRDGLIAASAGEAHRGKAFGLEGIGDNLGAFAGPLLAIALLTLLHFQLRAIFLVAVVPGLLAALMILLVRQRPVAAAAKAKLDLNVGRFPRTYWKYLLATALFNLGNSSNSFLILRTKDVADSLDLAILAYALFNFVAALASYPAGYLSDTLGRKRVLLVAFLLDLVVYAGFGFTTDLVAVLALFVLYGVYEGNFRAVGKALATDAVPPELRASGVGWYTATVGLSSLVASIVGGLLWTHVGPAATFLYGAAFALVGSLALVVLVSEQTPASRGRQPPAEGHSPPSGD